MTRNSILSTISVLLLLLFLYAAFSKLFDMERFRGELGKQPIPESVSDILLWVVPLVEIGISGLIAASMLNNSFTRIAMIASTALMGIFTVYTILAYSSAFGHVPCSCGGIIELLNWKQHLYFDFFFLAISITGIVIAKRNDFPEDSQHSHNKISIS